MAATSSGSRAKRRAERLRPLALFAALSLLLVRLPARGAEPAPRPIGVVDLHVDLSYQLNYKGAEFGRGTGQFPADELLRAGVVGVVLPLFVPARVSPTGPRRSDLEDSYRRVLAAIPRVAPYSAPGCGVGTGQVRTFLAFEGAAPLADDPVLLDEWATRGLRSVGLVHTRNNALAGSSGEPSSKGSGLTRAGLALVQRAAALGLPIDVSHASDQATRDVLTAARETKSVVIATHSNARALTNVPRNLADAELRGIAQTGGVIGVNFHSRFLAKGRRATLDDVVAHIRYLVRIVGIE
ncbi:MAG TPA: membrane dipeptidase, partial [Polyangiaceae bacterium]|nr:membrane dipeptidase [Polyangiaceae bacterium]